MSPPSSRVALLIGIENYAHLPELRTPYQDVRLLRNCLGGLGFEVVELGMDGVVKDQDVLREAIAALRERIERLPAAQADGWPPCVLVYYAGHGLVIGGRTYLIGETARPASDASLRSGSLPLSELIEALGARLDVPKVVLIDACQSTIRSRAFTPQAHALDVLPGDMVIDFATHPGEVAVEGATHSPYALALSEHLGDPVTIGDVLVSVTGRVRELTGLRQSPVTHVSLGVKLVIAPRPDTQVPVRGRTDKALSNAAVARARDRIVLFQSRDPAGQWAWYAMLVDEGKEQDFARAVADPAPLALDAYGMVLAVSHGVQASAQMRAYVKSRYGL